MFSDCTRTITDNISQVVGEIVGSESTERNEDFEDADVFMNNSNSAVDADELNDGRENEGELSGIESSPACTDGNKSKRGNCEQRKLLHSREKSLICEICSKGFSRFGYLKLHMKVHDRDPMFKCHLCPKQYTANSNLKIHLKTHTGERPYKCGICEHTSYSLSNLRKHMRIHTGERKHQCPICERWFMEKTAMTNHVRLHSGEKPFHCDICDEAFVRKTSLKYHMSSHTGERKYKCSYCTRSFSHKGNLNQHLRLHTGETPFQCELCPRAFKSMTSLQYHNKVHLNSLAYKCGICHRQFVQNSHLTNHMRTHTGEKPFKCEVCEKSFAQKSSLNSHTRIHTGERPFVCEFCGKSYSHQYYLNQHKKQHPEYTCDPFAARITQHDRDFKNLLIDKLTEVEKNEGDIVIKTELSEPDEKVRVINSKKLNFSSNKKQQKSKKVKKKGKIKNQTNTAEIATKRKKVNRKKNTSQKCQKLNVSNTNLNFISQNEVVLDSQPSHCNMANDSNHGNGFHHQDISLSNNQASTILHSLIKPKCVESLIQQINNRVMSKPISNKDVKSCRDNGEESAEKSDITCSSKGGLTASKATRDNENSTSATTNDSKGKYSILRSVLCDMPLWSPRDHNGILPNTETPITGSLDGQLQIKEQTTEVVLERSGNSSQQIVTCDIDSDEKTDNSKCIGDLNSSNASKYGKTTKQALDTAKTVSPSDNEYEKNETISASDNVSQDVVTEQSTDSEKTLSVDHLKVTDSESASFSHSIVSKDVHEVSNLSCLEKLSDKNHEQPIVVEDGKSAHVAESDQQAQLPNSDKLHSSENNPTVLFTCVDGYSSSDSSEESVCNDSVTFHEQSITVFDPC